MRNAAIMSLEDCCARMRDTLHHEVLQLHAVALHGGVVERRLRRRGRPLRVDQHLLQARVEQVVLDGERHPDARDDDRERGERRA